jgi:hypothetical protein
MTTLTIRNTGGTDHLSYDAVGLPGFQFIQDEIEYDTRTHHSNQDVFDRIQGDDLKQAATIMAAFLYNTASVPVAAGLLYPVFGIVITPIWASVAMSLSSLSVVANALRLRKIRL